MAQAPTFMLCEHSETIEYDNCDTYETNDGLHICVASYERSFFTCPGCDTIYNQDEINERDGEDYCQDCYVELDDEDDDTVRHTVVQPYDVDVLSELSGFLNAKGENIIKREGLYLGVELEVLPRDTSGLAARAVLDCVKGYAILKRDGSIPDRGFEIVSVPATHAWHQTGWDGFFAGPAKQLSGWSQKSCGMHVHVSRAAISPLTLGRILVFVNDKNNRGFIDAVAGRGSNSYCMKLDKKLTDGRQRSSSQRFEAVNIETRGHATIEFRIFQSNVARPGFLKNIDFVAAICLWSRDASNLDLTVNRFVEYVANNAGTYPNLVAWMRRASYLPKKRVNNYPKPEESSLCA
jgi:hypothetical protein